MGFRVRGLHGRAGPVFPLNEKQGERCGSTTGSRLISWFPQAWRKSKVSNPSGSCVEVAELPGSAIAVRNSRHPSGQALIYTRAEIGAFLTGVKNGEFDDLYPHPSRQRRVITR